MKKVEVYTSDTCGQCVKLKEYLKENNVGYIEYNISKDNERKKELIRLGYLSVPLTIVDEEQHILGMDTNRINELIIRK